jgi:hypothetical protein
MRIPTRRVAAPASRTSTVFTEVVSQEVAGFGADDANDGILLVGAADG